MGEREGKPGQERFLLVCFKDGRQYSVLHADRESDDAKENGQREVRRRGLQKFCCACLSLLSDMENGQHERRVQKDERGV